MKKYASRVAMAFIKAAQSPAASMRTQRIALRCRARSRFHAAADEVGLVVAEARVARSQLGSDDRARFGDGREQRVVAGTAVVVRVGSRQRALLRAEQRLDGGVDVQMQSSIAATTQVDQPLLAHQLLQVRDGGLVEASQIAIDRIEAGIRR